MVCSCKLVFFSLYCYARATSVFSCLRATLSRAQHHACNARVPAFVVREEINKQNRQFSKKSRELYSQSVSSKIEQRQLWTALISTQKNIVLLPTSLRAQVDFQRWKRCGATLLPFFLNCRPDNQHWFVTSSCSSWIIFRLLSCVTLLPFFSDCHPDNQY